MKEQFRISHNNDKYRNPVQFHSHDFCEIYFFIDGNVTYYIEDETYDLAKGDVLIIPPGKLHRPVIQNDIPYDRYVLWLYNSYITSNTGIMHFLDAINLEVKNKDTRLVSFSGSVFEIMTLLFDELLEKWRGLYAASDSHNSLSKVLLSQVCDSYNILILEKIYDSLKEAEKIEQFENMDNISNNLIRQVISYLNCNVTASPSLDELASQFFVSKYYLSHQFKEYTKLTIHQYILSKKINLAKKLLKSGKKPQQVCNLCGFFTYSNFYKEFTKQVGISPREFYKGKSK